MQKLSIALIIISLWSLCICQSPDTILYPFPSLLSFNESGKSQTADPCSVTYQIEANPQEDIKTMLNFYLNTVFKCKQTSNGTSVLKIVVKNASNTLAEKVQDQMYTLLMPLSSPWTLTADTYVGFIRGLETYSQLFIHTDSGYSLSHLPIEIEDKPEYIWRGLMIDSSRHFLTVNEILHQIDALMFSKLSILHWHIIDEDSFPMEVPTRPELSNYGKLSGSYSQTDIKNILEYARLRGVRVVVEIDSPAHTQSWGRSSTLKDIVVKCNNKYQGQFDPTLPLTYSVVSDVMKYVDKLFPDSYIHFGGDQINPQCYDNKPSIAQWMRENNIQDYWQLSQYYRKEQKKLWRQISKTKKVIYWANEDIDMPVDQDDVIQWWGASGTVGKLAGRKNPVILSYYDRAYLDLGFGGDDGLGYGDFIHWRKLYNYNLIVPGVNVVGGETCMWAELSNGQVQDQKVWPRTAVLGEKLWNTNIDGSNIINVVKRLSAHNKRLKNRSIKTSPVSVQLCENNPQICW